MSTTVRKYNPSVNIIRDFEKDLNYIPTPNSRLVFNRISSEYGSGVRSFIIIGAYGTGKSSFLWAFDKVLNGSKDFFELSSDFRRLRGFESINIVGQYSSIIETFANELKVRGDYMVNDVLRAIDNVYKKCQKKNLGLTLFIDEFGKFLEFAAKTNPEQELYFIQQLTEYINDLDKDILLVATLHQDFSSYSYGLKKSQRNEWSKVKGRWHDVAFNEPVEQLLYLAAESLAKNSTDLKRYKNLTSLIRTIRESKIFPLRDYFSKEIAEKLLPIDILAASVLTLSLQKYGQNDRSLFSFLESNDRLAVKNFDPKDGYFNLSHVYDYLISNYPIVNTKHNPHYTQWTAIRIAIEKSEGLFEDHLSSYLQIVKTIGILNIFGSQGSVMDASFLSNYGKYALGISNVHELVSNLDKFKVIRFIKHSQKYILFEGTDLDLELAIDEAGNLIDEVYGLVNYLNTYFDFPCILAKSYYYEYGTPRFFQFELSDHPISKEPIGEIDGYINLIFSEDPSIKEIRNTSSKCDRAIIFGVYQNTQEIRHLIYEIQKIEKVIENNPEDRVALHELKNIREHQVKLLNHYVLDSIYSDQNSIKWFFQGQELHFSSQREFNKRLSKICEIVYCDTPKFKNELVNKTKISNPIATAQKNLIRAICTNWELDDIGFGKTTFPPEKTIYLSLVKETGLLRSENGVVGFYEPIDLSFKALWKASLAFLESSKYSKRNLKEFVDRLSTKPFKLKKGFIDFWLPIFLFAKSEDYGLYERETYIPYVTSEVLELVIKSPHKYYLKAFDIEGVNLYLFRRYRAFLNEDETAPKNQSFIDTIRPFLTFYSGLPQYAKQTKSISKQAINLRNAIAKATNPEKSFFEEFPSALGYNLQQLTKNEDLIEEYFSSMQLAIRDLRTVHEKLRQRFEGLICDLLGITDKHTDYRKMLKDRFTKINVDVLPQHLLVFHRRLASDLDRNSWLSAIAQTCLGKALETITDADEPLLYQRFKEIVGELDNFIELSTYAGAKNLDDIFSIEITELNNTVKKQVVRFPKSKRKRIENILADTRKVLGKNKQDNLAAITLLLKEMLDE